jgi:ribosome production factor 2
MQRVVKPKTQKAKRALEEREPKAKENTKEVLFIRGAKTSEIVLAAMKDLCTLKKPHAATYSKKNEILPFEDHTKIEQYGKKEDRSLFVLGNHNKKRPHNLVFGRLHDHLMLDMVELGVQNFKGLKDFKNEKIAAGIKPCLLFSGEAFDRSPEMNRLKNLLMDFFRGPEVTNIRLAGVEHCIQFTAVKILLKRSSTPKMPRVELEEIGPSMDLVLRRSHLASDDLFKSACKQIKNLYKPKKTKNIEQDAFGSTLGTVHLPNQDVSNLQTRKMKGLKEDKKEKMQKKKEKAEKAKKAAAEKDVEEEEAME